jgi:hypothetical protein
MYNVSRFSRPRRHGRKYRKRRRAGSQAAWIKVKNRQHPAMDRVKEFLPMS